MFRRRAHWWDWLAWILTQYLGSAATRTVVGTVTVRKRADDLGAFLITMDRPLGPLLAPAAGTTYAAYRVRASLEVAHRLEKISYVSGDAPPPPRTSPTTPGPTRPRSAETGCWSSTPAPPAQAWA